MTLGLEVSALIVGLIAGGRFRVRTTDEALVRFSRRWYLVGAVLLCVAGVIVAAWSLWWFGDPQDFEHHKGLTDTEAGVVSTVGACGLLSLSGYMLSCWWAWRRSVLLPAEPP